MQHGSEEAGMDLAGDSMASEVEELDEEEGIMEEMVSDSDSEDEGEEERAEGAASAVGYEYAQSYATEEEVQELLGGLVGDEGEEEEQPLDEEEQLAALLGAEKEAADGMQTSDGILRFPYFLWDASIRIESPDGLVGVQCELDHRECEGEVPGSSLAPLGRVVVLAVSTGSQHYLVAYWDIAAFVLAHPHLTLVFHDAAGQVHCLRHTAMQDGKEMGEEEGEEAADMLLEMGNRSQIRDVQLLDSLIRLGLLDAEPNEGQPLTELAWRYLPFREDVVEQLAEENPRRLYYDMLVEEDRETWWSPAFLAMFGSQLSATVRSAVCIVHVYRRMLTVATTMAAPHKAQMLPRAIHRFGPLTEVIQVKASMALQEMYLHGIMVDTERAAWLRKGLLRRIEEATVAISDMPGYCELLGIRNGQRPQIRRTTLERLLMEARKEMLKVKWRQLAEEEEREEQQRKNDMPHSTSDETNTSGMEAERQDGKEKKEEEKGADSEPAPTKKKKKAKPRRKKPSAASLILIPLNRRSEISLSTKKWGIYAADHPFIARWIEIERAAKYLSFVANLYKPHVHPQYTTVVRNGRASARRPNIQQMPRAGGFREMFKAREGHVLVICDYSFIELCTLAVVCERRFGFSMLGQVIRQGTDPHCFTAAMFEKVDLAEFMAWKSSPDAAVRAKFKSLRQRAKAINFGIPGGEGAQALQEYALSAYGVTLTLEESADFRERLIREVYPELTCYLFEDCMDRLASRLGVPVAKCWARFARGRSKHPAVGLAIRNVTEGTTTRADGKPYRKQWVESVWRALRDLNRNDQLKGLIEKYYGVGHKDLARKLFGSQVATPTGRLRGGVTFTQSCNTPFSGLAADGAKIAMYNLMQIGFQLVAFIHDEIVVEVPETADLDAEARLVDQVMCESMQEVTGDIPIKCECCLARRWSKGAAPVYDAEGRLVVWEPEDGYTIGE